MRVTLGWFRQVEATAYQAVLINGPNRGHEASVEPWLLTAVLGPPCEYVVGSIVHLVCIR
ncbi:hypothetical protein DSUL_260014 [Desulfovibrionales bacterium]